MKYDHLLISGNFNIHVCCDSRPLVILNLISSFDFIQYVSGPTHDIYILDLVSSYALYVSISEICAATCISDHLRVLFTLKISCFCVDLRLMVLVLSVLMTFYLSSTPHVRKSWSVFQITLRAMVE